MSLGRKATIGASWMIAWRVVSRVLSVANTLILARLLVPADFGLVAMAMTFETSILMMTAFPVRDALLRRPESDTRLHDAAFTIQAARALALSLIVAAGAPLAATWFSQPKLTLMLLAIAATTAVNGFANIGIVEYDRELRFEVQFKLQLLPSILQSLSTIGTAWLTHSYWALVVGLAVMRISQVTMTYAVHPYRPRFSLFGWRQLVGFSFWLWLATLATMVWYQVDTFAIGPILGAASLGLYQLAAQVATLPSTELVDPLSSVLFASFAYSQREKATAATNPLPIASALLLLMAPMALVISADAGSLVRILLGVKWVAATPLVTIAAAQCLFLPFVQVARAALIARGHVRAQFLVDAATAVFRTGLIIGAAMTKSLTVIVIAAVVASAGTVSLYAFPLRAELREGFKTFLSGFARIALAATAAGLVLLACGLGWAPTDVAALSPFAAFLSLSIVTAVASVTYAVILLVLWFAFGRPKGPEKIILNLLKEFEVGQKLSSAAARVIARCSS